MQGGVSPASEVTELALARIVALEREGRIYSAPTLRGRMTRKSPGLVAPSGGRAESTILQVISVVEVFVDSLSIELTRKTDLSGIPGVATVVNEYVLDGASSWARRKDVYEKLHGVKLVSINGWSVVDRFVAVRNSVAHGLGYMTPTQRRSSTIHQKLLEVSVAIVDGKLDIGPNALDVARSGCREFVVGLDEAVR